MRGDVKSTSDAVFALEPEFPKPLLEVTSILRRDSLQAEPGNQLHDVVELGADVFWLVGKLFRGRVMIENRL